MGQPLWQPTKSAVESTQMYQFLLEVNRRFNTSLDTYDDLHNWSVNNIKDFWTLIWQRGQFLHSTEYTNVLSDDSMLDAKWFEGASLNFAENLLRHRNDQPAIISVTESGQTETTTYNELFETVRFCAAGFKKLGVSKNDRVAAYMPNVTETIIAMLAATSIGAIFSSCSSDFGLTGALARFGQIEPKVLITVDHYYYNGKKIDLSKRLEAMTTEIKSIEKTVIVNPSSELKNTKSLTWDSLLKITDEELVFEQLPFDHPVYIMYSSGTTGAPKCIVHGAGGTLLQHYKEHVLHTDLTSKEIICYFTTCGWMMWNWLVSGLQVGSAVVLYDGSPSHPDLSILWDIIDRFKITVFGTSPKFLTACQKDGQNPRQSHNLSSLRTILSTGAPLSGENFDYVYNQIKPDLQIASISGGTDIISCFMLGCPIKPVYREEIQAIGLGMKVETFSDDGKPLIDQVGELVCTAPFASQPIYFWNDPDRSKYKAAYFEHFPGVWRHGDYIKINKRGGVIVYGRSDATLNPGGVRIGTAEIYSTVEAINEIVDSIVIGQSYHDDTRIILFVKTKVGVTLDEQLIAKIKKRIREENSPRHVPSHVLQVNDIPHTINGKKVELAVTAVVHGREVKNREALANPEALEQFRKIAELAD